jgi:hypothetical protein
MSATGKRGSGTDGQAERPYRPTERQCALLILRLIQAREEDLENKGPKRRVSRARFSQNRIRRLCGRSQISNDFLAEIQEHLLAAGWALFCVGPTYYALINLESVQGWSRISSKRIADELKLVPRGEFPWNKYEDLLIAQENDTAQEAEEIELMDPE